MSISKKKKLEMSEYIEGQASALILAMDLDQLLGTTIYEQICTDDEMMAWCETEQRRIADKIKRERPVPTQGGGG